MRLLGVDFGFARIGIAVAETEPAIASPRKSLPASGTLDRDAEALAALASAEGADVVVVGLPLEQDGREGKMAGICRKLAARLSDRGLRVQMVDEGLTSVEAERRLRDSDPSSTSARRKKLRDGEAARLILERYMHEQEIA